MENLGEGDPGDKGGQLVTRLREAGIVYHLPRAQRRLGQGWGLIFVEGFAHKGVGNQTVGWVQTQGSRPDLESTLWAGRGYPEQGYTSNSKLFYSSLQFPNLSRKVCFWSFAYFVESQRLHACDWWQLSQERSSEEKRDDRTERGGLGNVWHPAAGTQYRWPGYVEPED